MIPKKLVKVSQKSVSKPSKSLDPQEKGTQGKSSVESRSHASSISNKYQDPNALIRNAAKNKETIEKRLKEDLIKQHEERKNIKKEISGNSNSSKDHSSARSQSSLNAHKRLQLHKQRAQSNVKGNETQPRSIISIGKSSVVGGLKQSIPNQSKHTKSDSSLPQNKDQKTSKKDQKIIQNCKPIATYFNKIQNPSKSRSEIQKIPAVIREDKKQQNFYQNKSKQSVRSFQGNHTGSKQAKIMSNVQPLKLNTNESKSRQISKNWSRTLSNDDESDSSPNNDPKVIDVEQISHKSDRQSSKKSSKKSSSFSENFQIPPYSEISFGKIDKNISRMNENLNQEGIGSFYFSVMCLMSWIWQANMPNYHLLRKQEKIDSSKCLRKLLEIYTKNNQISKNFQFAISLNKFKFQTDFYFEKPNLNTKSKLPEKMQVQESDSEEKVFNPKNFFIYELFRMRKVGHLEETKTQLIFLLVEIIIYNYDQIVSLDQMIFFNILKELQNIHSKTIQLHSNEQINQRVLQQLIVYTFTELTDLRVNLGRSPQFLKKKKLEGLLWKFFFDIMKILDNKLKAKEFINFRISEALVLQTAFNLATQFTYYAKKYPIKNIENINIIDFESFIQNLVERIIEFDVYVLQLKDRKKNSTDIEIDGPNRIFQFKFDLPIYDWAILAIKSDERKTFENIVKHCKKLFIKNLEKKSISKYEVYKNKPYVNDRYARFTIQELPEEQKSYYQDSSINRKREQQNSGYKISHDKVKGFVSIPHMSFLTFKESLPESVKRLMGQKKSKSSVQKIESHLLYLLILSNSDYLLKLIVEIEYVSIEMLSPEVGKGLIRLCKYCHDFKSMITGEKYLKILSLNSIHKELTEKIFEKDNDYQRRLSSTVVSRIVTERFRDTEQNKKEQRQSKSQKQQQQINILEVRVKSCETMYFELIMEIQNATPYINLEHYLQELMKNPSIFRHDKFYTKLLQIHHPSVARLYLYELIVRYIDDELRMFDMMAYFEIFAEYCLNSDMFDEMFILIRSLPIGKLIKFHLLLFSETFSDQISYRLQIPDGVQREERFSILTSAGFEDRTKFVDQNCTNIPQLILWRKYIKFILPFEKLEKYISIKSFFTIIHQVFSETKISSKNHQYIDSVIQKLKTWIQKDKIEEVASAFHFLSLALFPHHKSKTESNLSKNFARDRKTFFGSKIVENNTGIEEKFTLQILYLIESKKDSILEMYKNKQSLTMRCLGEEMRKRQMLDVDEKVDDMKRREVVRMLNKMKNVHDYMIRCVLRFIENVNFSNGMLRNFNQPQGYLENIRKLCRCQHMEKDQKTYQAIREFYTPKLDFKLSSVSSKNLFQQNFKKELKRYEENPMQLHDRYSFIVMIRCLAEFWIEEKMPSFKEVIDVQNESKSRSSKLPDKKQTKTKDKSNRSVVSSIISIEKLFEICIESLNNAINTEMGVRECEKLKQKLIALETLGLLFRIFTTKSEILKFMAPQIAKTYKSKYHSEVSSIIINLLMNNTKMLGREERDLVLVIRLKALSLLVENFGHTNKYSQYEWKIVENRENFWFLLNTLAFDKNSEIRFYLIKSLFSRVETLYTLRNSMIEKITIAALMSVQEHNKAFLQVLRKTIVNCLSANLDNSSSSIASILNTVVWSFFSFLVNFNTVYFLQKGDNKLDYRDFFMVLVDMIFDKKDFEAYVYGISSYFKAKLLDNKQRLDPSEIFNQIKWKFDINVDFYMMARAQKFRISNKLSEKNLNSNTKVYLELLEDMKDEFSSKQKSIKMTESKKFMETEKKSQTFDKMHPKSSQIFKANVQQALHIMDDVFLQRCAKSNKKSLKTKKPMTIFKNLGTVFSEQIRQKKDSLGKASHINLEKNKSDEIEID